MLFKSKNALSFLLKHGEVYTARPKRRKEGKDWITDRYGGKKIADVLVKLVAIVPADRFTSERFLERHCLRKSGFSDLKEWFDEIKKLNKGRIPRKLYVYYVKVLKR